MELYQEPQDLQDLAVAGGSLEADQGHPASLETGRSVCMQHRCLGCLGLAPSPQIANVVQPVVKSMSAK
eukprot:11168683-Lingulodinium_polyedra.AAC.1